MTMFCANFYMISNSFHQHSRPVSNLFLQPFTHLNGTGKSYLACYHPRHRTKRYCAMLQYTLHIKHTSYVYKNIISFESKKEKQQEIYLNKRLNFGINRFLITVALPIVERIVLFFNSINITFFKFEDKNIFNNS